MIVAKNRAVYNMVNSEIKHQCFVIRTVVSLQFYVTYTNIHYVK